MTPPVSRSRRRWIAPVLAAVVAAVLAASFLAGGGSSTDGAIPSTSASTTPPPVAVESDAPLYRTLDDLLAASDLVVRATVASTERGRVFGDPGDAEAAATESRLVAVEVAETLAGAEPPPVFYVEEEGWLADGSPLVVDGLAPSEEGQDAIWFLVDPTEDSAEASALVTVNAQGRYVVEGDTLVGAALDDALIRELEALGPDGLAAAVRQRAG